MTAELVGGARCGEFEDVLDTQQVIHVVRVEGMRTLYGQYTRTAETHAGRVLFIWQGWH